MFDNLENHTLVSPTSFESKSKCLQSNPTVNRDLNRVGFILGGEGVFGSDLWSANTLDRKPVKRKEQSIKGVAETYLCQLVWITDLPGWILFVSCLMPTSRICHFNTQWQFREWRSQPDQSITMILTTSQLKTGYSCFPKNIILKTFYLGSTLHVEQNGNSAQMAGANQTNGIYSIIWYFLLQIIAILTKEFLETIFDQLVVVSHTIDHGT